jgi:hypothetical protein
MTAMEAVLGMSYAGGFKVFVPGGFFEMASICFIFSFKVIVFSN